MASYSDGIFEIRNVTVIESETVIKTANMSSKPETESFEIFTIREHIMSKAMWTGALKRSNMSDQLMFCNTANGAHARWITNPHTPALFKIWDEILVNAVDHVQGLKQSSATHCVTQIDVTLASDGQFQVVNNGPGIPVVVHAIATETNRLAGRHTPVYVPEVAFGWELSGSNLTKTENNSVKAGVNGIGAKLANIHSMYFEVETIDTNAQLHYWQRFENRLANINVPTVKSETVRPDQAFTRITFMPAYAALDYPDGPSEFLTEFIGWLQFRLFEAATYVGESVTVTLNGMAIPINSVAKFAPIMCETMMTKKRAAGTYSMIPFRINPTSSDVMSWRGIVAISADFAKFSHRTVFNGVVVDKSPHILMYKKQIHEAVQLRIQQLTKDKKRETKLCDVIRCLCIITFGIIPDSEWSSQSKTEIQIADAKLRKYMLPEPVINGIADPVAQILAIDFMKSSKSKITVSLDKYVSARKLGSMSCSLLVAEGDSAISVLRTGLTAGKGVSFDTYGVMSLGGVIMNALKNVTFGSKPGSAERTVIAKSTQLVANKVLSGLVNVLGLEFGRSYENPSDLHDLHYDSIIGCTDQDLDGTGKILPLLLVFLFTFWPNLLRHGYVKKFVTPVIRATLKRKGSLPVEFYYENDFTEWCKANDVAKYRVKYFKGLAAHERREVVTMFQSFPSLIHTFTFDDMAATMFEVYFGKDPNLRKIALRTPVQYPTAEATKLMWAERRVSCTTQLTVDAKAYKLEAVRRQIPSAIDGLVPARRKILREAMILAAKDNKEYKVYQFGGFVAAQQAYHHGDASLNSTIINMAQTFPGARLHPLLIGIGEFGSRHTGGADAGSPRYIAVKSNQSLNTMLFPHADDCLLPFVFEDGERAEPLYYVPILPLAIMEGHQNPSEGWSHLSFARQMTEVIGILRQMLDPESVLGTRLRAIADAFQTKPFDMPEDLGAVEADLQLQANIGKFHGEVRDGWHYGVIEFVSTRKAIRVTDLPITVATDTYLKTFNEKLVRGKPNPLHQIIIPPIDNHGSADGVDITIPLRPDVWEKYKDSPDELMVILHLRKSLKSALNYVRCDGSVVEFGSSYLGTMMYWFGFRKQLYHARLDREIILLELRIMLEESILRYIQAASQLQISKLADDDAMIAVLQEHTFPSIHATLLSEPGFYPTDQLRALILGGTVHFDYILNLRERDLVQKSYAARLEKVVKYRRELELRRSYLGNKPFAGATLWLSEIDILVNKQTVRRPTR